MEEKLTDVLDNLLGLLLLEGSYEIEEGDDAMNVLIETDEAGRLIGARGESLDGLQLIVNQIMSRKTGDGEFKKVIIDVSGWRKQKEEELTQSAKEWGKQVLESGKEMELEPQSPWQRRIVHSIISEIGGLETESMGEGRDRHIVIRTVSKSKSKPVKKSKKVEADSKALSKSDSEAGIDEGVQIEEKIEDAKSS